MSKFCKKCGKVLENDANFCTVCGTNNAEVVENTTAGANDSVQTPPPTPVTVVTPTSTAPASSEAILIPSAVQQATNNEVVSSLQSMPEIATTAPVAPVTTMGAYDRPFRKAKKRKRKNDAKIIYVVAAVAGSLFVLIILVFLLVFLLSFKGGTNENETKIHNPQLTEKESFRIGNADFGFVSVPNGWTPYKQDEGNRTLQYSNGSGWIVTLYSVPASDASAQEWATSIVGQMKSAAAEDIGLEETKIDQCSGYKVFAYYKNVSTYLAAWILNGTDGKSNCIAIEGPNRYDDNYDIIYTFNLTK